MGDRQCEGTRVSGSVRCARAVQPLALCGTQLRKSGPSSQRPPVGEQPWGRAGYVSAQSDGLLEGNPASGPGRPGERALELAKGHAPPRPIVKPAPFHQTEIPAREAYAGEAGLRRTLQGQSRRLASGAGHGAGHGGKVGRAAKGTPADPSANGVAGGTPANSTGAASGSLSHQITKEGLNYGSGPRSSRRESNRWP